MKYLIAKAKSLKTFMNFYDILFLITSCVQASLLLIYKIVMFLFFFWTTLFNIFDEINMKLDLVNEKFYNNKDSFIVSLLKNW